MLSESKSLLVDQIFYYYLWYTNKQDTDTKHKENTNTSLYYDKVIPDKVLCYH